MYLRRYVTGIPGEIPNPELVVEIRGAKVTRYRLDFHFMSFGFIHLLGFKYALPLSRQVIRETFFDSSPDIKDYLPECGNRNLCIMNITAINIKFPIIKPQKGVFPFMLQSCDDETFTDGVSGHPVCFQKAEIWSNIYPAYVNLVRAFPDNPVFYFQTDDCKRDT